MLSMEFHPGFATNGIFFVAYIAPGGSPYIDRVSVSRPIRISLTVNTNTQQILYGMVDREFNHNGSDLHFRIRRLPLHFDGDEGGPI